MKNKAAKNAPDKYPLGEVFSGAHGQALVKRFPKLGYGLAGLVLVAGIGLLNLGVTFAGDQFPIRSVQVGGQFRQVAKLSVEKVLDRYVSENFFRVNLTEVQQVLQELPWVYRASVRRVWPDKIYVTIDEELPVAWWQKNKLINGDGHIFEPDRVDNVPSVSDLPRLFGPQGASSEVMAAYHQMGRLLYRADLEVVRLALSERRTWEIQLSSGMAISIDRNRTLDKLRRFVAFYNSDLKQKNKLIEKIDLRYENGIAVSWKEDSLLALNEI